ncbi:hypothetical protein RHGRI_015413 [Rhododendron griersonianum]|uniref:F-box associated beta-propeller type 1 domain-containing protein n=1 Tax=Rhododendron griersonianum TaxID=479676 RepID=A0AAV6KD51_9ERIC|nr:hypothetical protein RHGRI_015413 [Rhododendron griersonianum]
MGSNKWREIEAKMPSVFGEEVVEAVEYEILGCNTSAFLNGVFYWEATVSVSDEVIVVSFDMDNEEYCPLILCNPATRDFRKIPNDVWWHISNVAFGFGFHNSANDYELIRIVTSECFNPAGKFFVQIDIYEMGSDNWRRIEDTMPPFSGEEFDDAVEFYEIEIVDYEICGSSASAFLNGVFYWVASVSVSGEVIVVSFDMGDEALLSTSVIRMVYAYCNKWRGIEAKMPSVYGKEVVDAVEYEILGCYTSAFLNGVFYWEATVSVSDEVIVVSFDMDNEEAGHRNRNEEQGETSGGGDDEGEWKRIWHIKAPMKGSYYSSEPKKNGEWTFSNWLCKLISKKKSRKLWRVANPLDKWRGIEAKMPSVSGKEVVDAVEYEISGCCTSAFLNGVFYWEATVSVSDEVIVVSFDMDNEDKFAGVSFTMKLVNGNIFYDDMFHFLAIHG